MPLPATTAKLYEKKLFHCPLWGQAHWRLGQEQPRRVSSPAPPVRRLGPARVSPTLAREGQGSNSL